ncbi:MAG: histidine phosphatase family protein [Ignavibacteriaceae bacterium]
MNIYLIRHGKAEPTSSLVDDKERQLTDEGKKILRSSAEQWKSVIKQPDFILTSPLIRAVQTAEIIAEVMNFNDGVLNENLLLPGSSTNSLIGNTEVNLKFSPGSIAKISFEGKPKLGKGVLAFLLPPVTI